MAKLDFPSASASPFVAPNGVTYTYIGVEPNGHWSGTEADGAVSLEGKFVEVSGDDMSGDLTLGTNKIKLDATAGNATFEGYVKSNNYLWGNPSRDSAGIYNYQNLSTLPQAYIQQNSGNVNTIELNWDGSASFANGKNTIASNGALNIYADPSNTSQSYSSIGNGGRVVLSRTDTTSAALEITPTNSANSKTFLYSDGSASFAGGDVNIDSSGNIKLTFPDGNTGLRNKISFGTESPYQDETAYIAANRTAVNFSPTDLVFATGTSSGVSEKMRIDSTGTVSINQPTYSSTAQLQLDAKDNTAYVPSVAYPSNQIEIQNAVSMGSAIVRFRSQSSNSAAGVWNVGAVPRPGNLVSDFIFQSRTADSTYSEIARFSGNGGILFNGNTAQANALDDYEEGTWTPTIEGGETAGSYTLADVTAYYTKIGNRVIATARFRVLVNSAGTGYARIGGLPVNYKADTGESGSCFFRYWATNTTNVLTASIANIASGSDNRVAVTLAKENGDYVLLPITGVGSPSFNRLQFTYIYQAI